MVAFCDGAGPVRQLVLMMPAMCSANTCRCQRWPRCAVMPCLMPCAWSGHPPPPAICAGSLVPHVEGAHPPAGGERVENDCRGDFVMVTPWLAMAAFDAVVSLASAPMHVCGSNGSGAWKHRSAGGRRNGNGITTVAACQASRCHPRALRSVRGGVLWPGRMDRATLLQA